MMTAQDTSDLEHEQGRTQGSAPTKDRQGYVRLFVYGSLKRGFENESVLEGAKFVQEARTVPGYVLFDMGSYPALVAHGDGVVHGEIFDVPETMLSMLDSFESDPYQRDIIQLHATQDAHTYLVKHAHVKHFPILADGRWHDRAKEAP